MNAARGERCTVNIPGFCNYNAETVVFAHHNDGTGGSNRLTGALTGGFACDQCHAAIDSRIPHRICGEDMEFFKRRSMIRTLERLIDRGLVTVRGLGR